ncbi:hypothetical protein LTR62_004984 [Meristemomyces frigidus]|uniref:C3H1-type domain-containing protein n=1 Tax=Meristemomyces frigidus TaxID=1508187 RepID=A0AAN7TN63_9PEZI|nr:hypothetical protein LTR62_004984 [Meristemomyces frigidus]
MTSHGTNYHLANQDTLDPEQKHRQEIHEQQRADRRRKRSIQEQSRILHHIDSAGDSTNRAMVIDGIHFRLSPDGAKLTRAPGKLGYWKTPSITSILNFTDMAEAALATPKKIKIANVDFCRTCVFGARCHFQHDPSKVAICKDFLKSGSCLRGDNCDMSHEMTYHRVPACQYFQRGNCTNTACRYPHVLVSPAASVCPAFATIGFCAKGSDCDKRHVHECPKYANKGFCAEREKGRCPMPHPDRASLLRKAAGRAAKMSSDAESDISSSEDDDRREEVEDIDSDEEDVFIHAGGESHELAQQQDFVGFS